MAKPCQRVLARKHTHTHTVHIFTAHRKTLPVIIVSTCASASRTHTHPPTRPTHRMINGFTARGAPRLLATAHTHTQALATTKNSCINIYENYAQRMVFKIATFARTRTPRIYILTSRFRACNARPPCVRL